MYSYPAEYLLHPVPVLAIYGLSSAPNTLDDTKLVDVDEPAASSNENASSVNASPPSTRSGLASSLLSLFTSKSDYSLYEASRHVSSNQIPPPFRVITVSKVRHLRLKRVPSADREHTGICTTTQTIASSASSAAAAFTSFALVARFTVVSRRRHDTAVD